MKQILLMGPLFLFAKLGGMGLSCPIDEHARYFKALRLKFPEIVGFYILNSHDEKATIIKEFIKRTIDYAFQYKNEVGSELELALEKIKHDSNSVQHIFKPILSEISNRESIIEWNNGWTYLKKYIESKKTIIS